MSELGWSGKMVKHEDGRKGVIRREHVGFLHCGLRIAVEGGGEASVQLNTNGPDTGEKGWSWLAGDKPDEGPWYRLGDHN